MDLVDGEHSREMVDSGVKTDFVHDGYASFLGLGIELQHGGRNVRGRYDVLLLADRRLDDSGVVCVRNERDGNVDLGDLSIKSIGIVDVKLELISI